MMIERVGKGRCIDFDGYMYVRKTCRKPISLSEYQVHERSISCDVMIAFQCDCVKETCSIVH